MLVSQQIRNLIAGVSQQPPVLRHMEQLEEQLNGFSTATGGLQKRPPTLHVGFLKSIPVNTVGVKPLVHFIKRDKNERYAVILTGSGIYVYDDEGVAHDVQYDNTALEYISTSNPRVNLHCVSIADYTFIVNTTKKVAMVDSKSANVWATQGALINVKSGQYGRTYKILVDGVVKASFETPDGGEASHVKQIDTNYIAGQLINSLTTNGYTCQQFEGAIYITGNNIQNAEITTRDGYNNLSMYAIQKTVQKFTNLPSTAPSGYTVRITGEPSEVADDYYVAYNATEKVWEECVCPNVPTTIESTTMPYTLIRNADMTFTLKDAQWGKRKSGDEDSNLEPSFVGNPISDVFFFRNRLGLLSGENVILSNSSDFFNFWYSSVVEIQDTDVIDIAVSDNVIALLKQAIPFGEELILFSDNGQYAMSSSSGTLTPKTATLKNLTSYANNSDIKPVSAGRNIYFCTERSLYTSLNEYITAYDNTDNKDAEDISIHVPDYIPNGVHKIVTSTTENVLLLLTSGAPNKIFVYKYLFIGGQKQQSSWSEWDMQSEVIGADFFDSNLFCVMKREEHYYLEYMKFMYNTTDFTTEPYRVYLDRKVMTPAIEEGAYNAVDNTTTLTLSPYYNTLNYLDSVPMGIITTDGTYHTIVAGANTVTLIGNYVGQQVFIGQIYLFRVTLSPFYIKNLDNQGKTNTTTEGRLQIHRCWLQYSNSGYFTVNVTTPLNVNTYEYRNTLYSLDSNSSSNIGAVLLKTGVFKIPVQAQNTKAIISITSDTPNPVALVGAGWEGNFNKRAKQL